MNLLHLKYAVEVAKTSSITKAAENLYMGQPNLSRAIKELEEDLGIRIFQRSSRGIVPTEQGEAFLGYARTILQQVDAIEKMYREERQHMSRFSVSAPRAAYVACAFAEFVGSLDTAVRMDIVYQETNALRAVNNILDCGYHLGVIRYQAEHERFFKKMLGEKGITAELIHEFEYGVLFSRESPLAIRDEIWREDLEPLIEIVAGDPYAPETLRGGAATVSKRRIAMFESGSQLETLSRLPNAYMWASAMPRALMEKYGLLMRPGASERRTMRDVLIYKKDYRLAAEDMRFIDMLMKQVRALREGNA